MPSGRKEKLLRSGTRRRKSLQSSHQMIGDALASSACTLTGQLSVDLPLVAAQQGVDFMPPVQTVVLPAPAGQPAAATGTEPALSPPPDPGADEEPSEPPPPPPSPYQLRLDAISERYRFYQPRVRVQVRAAAAQRDPETGQMAGPPHGVQVSSWRCEAEHLTAMRRCFSALDGLSVLSLNNAALDEPAMAALAALLAEKPTITTVNLDSNPGIGPLVAPLLQPPSNVQAFSLRNCAVTDDVIEALRPALSEVHARSETRFNSPPLRKLNLTNNHLTDAGAQTLALILRSNRQLSSLSLTRNRIGTAGAEALAAVLRPFPLTHDEVVASRRARAVVRKVFVERLETASRSKSCCAGKCTHANRRCDADSGSADRSSSPGGSLRGGRGGATSRGSRSPAKQAARRTEPPPPPPPTALQQSVSDLLDGVIHPLMTLVQPTDGRVISPGNLVLTNLSLAYNGRVGPPAAAAFLETLRYQQTVPAEASSRLGPGLLRLSLAGTAADGDPQLTALLARRQPALAEPEPPAEPEERVRTGRGRQSELTITSSRRTASRSSRPRKGKSK